MSYAKAEVAGTLTLQSMSPAVVVLGENGHKGESTEPGSEPGCVTYPDLPSVIE